MKNGERLLLQIKAFILVIWKEKAALRMDKCIWLFVVLIRPNQTFISITVNLYDKTVFEF